MKPDLIIVWGALTESGLQPSDRGQPPDDRVKYEVLEKRGLRPRSTTLAESALLGIYAGRAPIYASHGAPRIFYKLQFIRRSTVVTQRAIRIWTRHCNWRPGNPDLYTGAVRQAVQ